MEKLKEQLDRLIDRLDDSEAFRKDLESLVSVYPFNEYEYIISHLLALRKLTIDDYYRLRNAYLERNLYLYLFEISAPRGLGDKWAFGHLKQLIPQLEQPSKKLDSRYAGEYDFILPYTDKQKQACAIRIEVKTSRAVDFEKPDEPLYIKALSWDSKKPFDMNFQQIKPRCADVFVWIGIWRDCIRYWVLNAKQVEQNRFFSKGQHRGNVGEGQLHITRENIDAFKNFLTPSDKLKSTIIKRYNQLKR